MSPLTAAQLDAHYKNIGGSVAPIVAGLSPWESPLERYYIMRGELKPKDLSDNSAVECGELIEEVAAELYRRRTGRKLRRYNDTMVDKEHPFIIAHPDRLIVGERRGLECKNTRYASPEKWGPSGTDQVPEYFFCQCQHYMRVFGYPLWDLIALVGGNEPRIYTIARDEEFIADLVQIEVLFMQRVREGNPPPAMSLDDVDLRWKKSVEKAVPANDSLVGDVFALELARKDKSDAAEREEAIKLRIAAHMGDADTLMDGERAILTYKDSFPKRVNTDLLKLEFPDVYAKVAQPSRSRTMRIVKGEAA